MIYFEFLEICADLYLLLEQVIEDHPDIINMSSYDATGYLSEVY